MYLIKYVNIDLILVQLQKSGKALIGEYIYHLLLFILFLLDQELNGLNKSSCMCIEKTPSRKILCHISANPDTFPRTQNPEWGWDWEAAVSWHREEGACWPKAWVGAAWGDPKSPNEQPIRLFFRSPYWHQSQHVPRGAIANSHAQEFTFSFTCWIRQKIPGSKYEELRTGTLRSQNNVAHKMGLSSHFESLAAIVAKQAKT